MKEILVADVVMGGGKSSGAQTYCLENSHKKFVYIAPFLDEASRFAQACAPLRFVEPQQISDYNRSKILHIEHLIEHGRNVATTHVAFSALTKKTLEMIAEQEYELICDETVDAIKLDSVYVKDLLLLEKAGMLERDKDAYKFVGDDDYIDGNSLYSDLCRLSRSNNVYFESEVTANGKKENYYYLLLPKEVFDVFSRVIILTYMFESSNLAGLLKIYDLPYQYIGVERVNYGNGYMLSKGGMYVPDYICELRNKIHVYEYDSNPIIGRGRPPKNLNQYKKKEGKLSPGFDFKPNFNFFKNSKENDHLIKELKNNQDNFFEKIISKQGGSKEDCMWSTYEIGRKKMTGRGLQKKWVAFNTRATNEYRNKKYISYVVDLHLNRALTHFYDKHGIRYNEREWALSTMIQFLWRSRLRNSEEIWLYLPAARMREILYEYLDNMSSGKIHGSMNVELTKTDSENEEE